MSTQRLRLAIPPGHADAHCLTCRADVVIPEGTLRCPNGDHDVEITSLAHMPKNGAGSAVIAIAPELRAAMDDGLMMTAPVAAARPAPATAAEVKVEKATVEAIALPDSAITWYAETSRLRDELLDEEIGLQEQLRRVRGTRKRLDLALGLFVAPEPVAAPAPQAPPTITRDQGMARLKAARPTSAPVSEASAKPWSKQYPCCINCGTTAVKHAGNGRCRACSGYWYRKGEERPPEMWSKEQTP